MTDILNVEKNLKQTCLPFGKLCNQKKENKENIPCGNDMVIDNISTIATEEGNTNKENEVTFKSLSRKEKKHIQRSNLIEVKVDVHQTIQCPEISTSSIESELNKANEEEAFIDLTSDSEISMAKDEIVSEPSKIPEDVLRNIEESIETVIKRGLTDSENMVQNRDCVRDRKRKSRPPSQKPLSTLNTSVNPSNENQCHDMEESVQDCITSTPSSSKHDTKKPRRSILDMWASVKKKSDEPSLKRKASPTVVHAIVEWQENDIQIVGESMDVKSVDSSKKRARSKSPSGHLNMNCCNDMSADEKPLITDETNEISDAKKARVSPVSPDVTLSPISTDKSSQQEQTNLTQTPPTSNSSPPASKPKSSSKSSAKAHLLKEERKKEKELRKKLKEEEKLAKAADRLEKQQKKEEEKKRKKEELDKAKEEKLKKKQEEQEKRKAELEAKRLEKERKDEEKRLEKEKRDEEKRAKEEEKRVKEEEKQKLLQEKVKLEEEKRRTKAKQASSFKNFFTSPPRSPVVKQSTEKVVGSFIPFQVKEDMFLSPRHKQLTTSLTSALDKCILSQDYDHSYLSDVKITGAIRFRSRTLPIKERNLLSLSEDGLEVMQTDKQAYYKNIRAKLLQFSENNRPPYYGSWRKRSSVLNPRNPFKQDSDIFDYEVDSDDEWEDPGEGEDIANSDGEEDGEKEDEEEEGDGFFVPHGYLSDDEGINEDGDDDMKEELSDQKLKLKQQEFENAFKQKIKVMEPLTVGCVWEDCKGDFSSEHLPVLQNYEIQFFMSSPIDLDEKKAVKSPEENNKSKSENKSSSSVKKSVPDEAIPDLVRMLHGNPHSLGKLVPEFQYYWQRKNDPTTKSAAATSAVPSSLSSTASDEKLMDQSPVIPGVSLLNSSPQPRSSPYGVTGLSMVVLADKGPYWISKTQIREKIREIGVYGRKEKFNRACWFVLDQVFEKYGLKESDYPLPCKWEHLTFEADLKLYRFEITPPSIPTTTPVQSETPVKCSIDKFATKVSAEDLLEKSSNRIRQEKEKQSLLVQPVQSVDKFAVAKIAPDELLENTKQKIEQEQMKQKRRVSLTTISLADDKESPDNDCEASTAESASFGLPSHAAFQSFFKLNKKSCPTKEKSSPEVKPLRSKPTQVPSRPCGSKSSMDVVNACEISNEENMSNETISKINGERELPSDSTKSSLQPEEDEMETSQQE